MAGSTEPQPYEPLTRAQGKRITKFNRIFYAFQDTLDTSNGPLEVALEDGNQLLFRGGGDGERLVVEPKEWTDSFVEPLSPENKLYVEQYGVWRRVDVTQDPRYHRMLDEPVTYTLLINTFNSVGGVHIQTHNAAMWFVIEVDEERVYWQPPEGFRPA